MPFCGNCGKQLDPEHRFCTACGTPVPQAAPKQEPPTPQSVAAPVPDLSEEDAFFSVFQGPKQEPVFRQSPHLPESVRELVDPPAAPPAEPKGSVPRASRVKKPRKAGTVIVSILLCIFLVLSAIPVFSLLTVQNALQAQTVENFLKRLDLQEIPMDQLDPGYGEGTLADYLCQELNSAISDSIGSWGWEPFTPQSLERFMRRTTFPRFIGQQSMNILEAVLEGETEYSIRTRDVEKVLKQNRDYLEEELGILLDNEDITRAALQFLEDSGMFEISLEMDDSYEDMIDLLRAVLAPGALISAIAPVAVLLMLLYIANWRHLRCALRDTGLVSLLSAVPWLAGSLVLYILIPSFAGSNGVGYMACVAASCILESSISLFAIVSGCGVILLIVSALLKPRKKR